MPCKSHFGGREGWGHGWDLTQGRALGWLAEFCFLTTVSYPYLGVYALSQFVKLKKCFCDLNPWQQGTSQWGPIWNIRPMVTFLREKERKATEAGRWLGRGHKGCYQTWNQSPGLPGSQVRAPLFQARQSPVKQASPKGHLYCPLPREVIQPALNVEA